MKVRLALLKTFLFVLVAQLALAQSKEVTGTVTSADDGQPLPGATVVIEGTTTGSVTDLDGKYRLNASEGQVLLIKYIGMEDYRVTIGTANTYDVSMQSGVELDELVVTANAIVREKKELGYALTSVDGSETTKARDANVLNTLAGKVPGVRITSQSGTVGGGSKIIIRGANSFGGDNQPLFVVDGVPISNSGFNGDRNEIIGGGVDVGNRIGDLNPDDIASMTVLKGAAASALYGSRAKDGAIIITTKSGKGTQGGKKSTITVNSSLRFDTPLRLPDFQNEYASGDFGQFNETNFINGWGPRINGQEVTDFKGDTTNLTAQPDNVRDFYDVGRTLINSIALADASDDGDFRVGYTNFQQKGIVPNSELERNSISINVGRNLSDKLSARVTANYVRNTSQGRPGQGSNDPNIVTSIVNGLPRTTSIDDLRNNLTDELGNPYGVDGARTVNNPFWVTENNLFTQEVDRIFGSAQVEYKILDWLTATYRYGTDVYQDSRRRVVRQGTLGAQNGNFTTREIFDKQINSDFILSARKDLDEKFTLSAIAGHNVNDIFTRRYFVQSQDLVIDELYNFANAESNTQTNTIIQRRLWGVYGDVTLGYDDYLFLNITGRNDWNSTLPEENRSYFYPSTSLSFVFSEFFSESTREWFTYGKARANYAQVGSAVDPYSLDFTFNPLNSYFVQYLGPNTYPHGGQLAFGATNIIPNPELKPQNQRSIEFGTELVFLNGRLRFDGTYYKTNTTDQIVNITVPQSTGFNLQTVNIGEVENSGIELLLSGTPVQTKSGFAWTVTLNWSRNRNRVVELPEGLDRYVLTSGFSGLQIQAEEGEAFGLYGNGWARVDDNSEYDGQVIINPSTGLRQIGETERLGDIYPEWIGGINNEFTYKNFALSFLVDVRVGGVIYSATVQGLRSSGLAEETLENRGSVFIDEGVIQIGEGEYRPNDVPVESMQQFWGNYSSNTVAESNVFDADFAKLRELRFGYSLPNNVIKNTPFSGISFAVEARNLWLIWSKVPHIDPEANFFGTSLTGEGVEFNSVPSTRSFGFNLTLTL